MLLEGVLAFLVIGLLLGGKLNRFAALDLKALWCFVAAFVIQGASVLLSVTGWRPAMAAVGPAQIVSYAPLFYGLWRNRHLWPIWIAALGVILNFTVIAANGGQMPTSEEAIRRSGQAQYVELIRSGRYGRNRLIGPATRLAFLGDVHALARPYPRRTVFSLGDAALTLGAGLLVLAGLGLIRGPVGRCSPAG